MDVNVETKITAENNSKRPTKRKSAKQKAFPEV
jgi:hypothetical protein